MRAVYMYILCIIRDRLLIEYKINHTCLMGYFKFFGLALRCRNIVILPLGHMHI